MIRKETIQNILDAAHVEEVVGDFVSLKKRGANYVGLCPFHNEKTPSFTVSPSKGFYHCFGCGKSGGSVDFVMQHEHMSYPEALRFLARKYNIEVVEKEATKEELRAQSEQESMFSVVEFARKHFINNLFQTEEGKAIGLTYFTERGFNRELITKFQLGYSPEKWEDLTECALKEGYDIKFLEKTGLSIKRENGGYYDRFRERVIFPVHNLSGRVVGYSARILKADKNKPKYVNSPESEIYNKSKTLYGIYFAKPAIVTADNCFLVEGNTDVISLFQAGIENVVASSGTALTSDQIRIIKRFTRNITIIYDGDQAGIKASLRGIDLVLEEGMNVKIILLPDGEDPDSFVKKHDIIQVRDFIKKNAENFITFKTRLLLDEAQHDPLKKAELIKEIVRTVSLIPEPIHRSLFIKECAELMKVPEASLFNELNKILRKKLKKIADQQTSPEENEPPEITEFIAEPQILSNPYDTLIMERYLAWLILNFGTEKITLQSETDENQNNTQKNLAVYIMDVLKAEEITFSDANIAPMLDEYIKATENDEKVQLSALINHCPEKISETIIDVMKTDYELSSKWAEKYKIYTRTHLDENKKLLMEDLGNTINVIQLKRISKQLYDIEQELKNAGSDNVEEVMILMDKFRRKQAIYMKVSEKLGRVIN